MGEIRHQLSAKISVYRCLIPLDGSFFNQECFTLEDRDQDGDRDCDQRDNYDCDDNPDDAADQAQRCSNDADNQANDSHNQAEDCF